MFSVMGRDRWLHWCQARQLDVFKARFAIETCYYGAGFRSRPGALLLNEHGITHFSYSVWDTLYAAFEKSIRIEMPLAHITVVKRGQLPAWMNAAMYHPEACFEVEMADGSRHHLILYRESDQFSGALFDLGVRQE